MPAKKFGAITITVLEFSITVRRDGRNRARTYRATRRNIQLVADYITRKQYNGQAQVRPWCGSIIGYIAAIVMTYRFGDVVCLTCGQVIKNDPLINGISHGYCGPCGQAELAKADTWISQRQATRIKAEFTAIKTQFAAQVAEATR